MLFADLKDSLELIRDLDPEATQQPLDPALHAMMDAVHRYEGTVNQVLGDGIMALLALPLPMRTTPSGPATRHSPCRRHSAMPLSAGRMPEGPQDHDRATEPHAAPCLWPQRLTAEGAPVLAPLILPIRRLGARGGGGRSAGLAMLAGQQARAQWGNGWKSAQVPRASGGTRAALQETGWGTAAMPSGGASHQVCGARGQGPGGGGHATPRADSGHHDHGALWGLGGRIAAPRSPPTRVWASPSQPWLTSRCCSVWGVSGEGSLPLRLGIWDGHRREGWPRREQRGRRAGGLEGVGDGGDRQASRRRL